VKGERERSCEEAEGREGPTADNDLSKSQERNEGKSIRKKHGGSRGLSEVKD